MTNVTMHGLRRSQWGPYSRPYRRLAKPFAPRNTLLADFLDHEALQTVESAGNYATIPDVQLRFEDPHTSATFCHFCGEWECCRNRELVGVRHATVTPTPGGVAALKAES